MQCKVVIRRRLFLALADNWEIWVMIMLIHQV